MRQEVGATENLALSEGSAGVRNGKVSDFKRVGQAESKQRLGQLRALPRRPSVDHSMMLPGDRAMTRRLRRTRRTVAGLLLVAGILSFGYVGVSSYVAEQLVYAAPIPIDKTPASLGLRFAYVTFPSRQDHLTLRGWFIPGVLANGRLTADRAIVVVHGTRTNRESKGDHQLQLTRELARPGLAGLDLRMRRAR